MLRRLVLMLVIAFVGSAAAQAAQVAKLKITVLSTMLADQGIGEWGYAALVEADGRRILFDTGARPETVLANAREMGIDLALIEEVVISHNHADHTGGLVTLRRELMKTHPKALSRVHVAEGIFVPRVRPDGRAGNGLLQAKAAYEALGGRFIVHRQATEIAPGVWFTGPVARRYPDENPGSSNFRLATAGPPARDIVAEDASLAFDTADGLVLLVGCGHAGIVNTAEHARATVRAAPLHAVIGGLHLFDATDERLAWVGDKLREFGLAHLLAGHCTGIEATFRLREVTKLARRTAVVSSVGSSFTLGQGIDPRGLAR
jgi:7,8-dihydropterin-6-yl-methyl-4-(beta-D-ribofuranosyl)aminobenzene 5'-phosphate synthase